MKYLLVLVLLLVGCTQTVTPTGSPNASASPGGQPSASSVEPGSPNATPTCSPMGGTPFACTPDEYEKVEEQNRLTEEAIALYRRWTKESTRLYRAGGTNKATAEMKAIMAGDALKSGLGIFQDVKATRARAKSGEVKIVTIGPDSAAATAGGEVAIRACLDARSLAFYRDGKKLRNGVMFSENVVARVVSGNLKLWSATSQGVTSCAS